jgi:outer membrane receptor protein involved in Fe transport
MKSIFISVFVFVAGISFSVANDNIKGKVLNGATKEALPFVYVQILNSNNKITYTDAEGNYEFKSLSPGTYTITYVCIGFRIRTDTVQLKDNEPLSLLVYLQEDIVEIPEVHIAARKEFSQTTINSLDFKLRSHNTTQDLLRLVPGLFIAQHAGGGKAEQLFLRGFDVDHGTDVAISVDGMPVNMVSHAHGQGYADLHFVIPETVENMSFAKGPYDAKTGDFNTAGAVRFQTKNRLQENMAKYETGRFGMQRGMLMFNLLKNKGNEESKHSAYLASEYFYTKGFFISPQHFNRFNIFGKYQGKLSASTSLSVSMSAFNSRWNGSGQIPERAVENGMISRYGSIDPSEGGNTSRNNVVATITKKCTNASVVTNQFYFTNYNFNLFSNFTFFKKDSISGDQVNQYEHRNVFGYNGSYSRDIQLGNITVKTMAGIGLRADRIYNIGLSHTFKRQFLNDVRKGDVSENNANGFMDVNLLFSERFSLNLGVRYDYFTFRYSSRLDDTSYASANKGLASPKLNLFYKPGRNIQLYMSGGYGFHSNDARVAVQAPQNALPKALGFDLGTYLKIRKKVFLNVALWYLHMQTEFVYGGDDGLIGPRGRTERTGIDASARYQVLSWLFVDADLNLARSRFIDLPEGENYVRLAPVITSIGGIGINNLKGWSGSLRYRHLGRRPAAEDNSIVASGYFIVDAVINYQIKKFSVNLSIENMLNRNWKEAQFGTESRLKGEPQPISEIHFTPGTPFFIKLGFTLLF